MYIRVLIIFVCLNVCNILAQDPNGFYGTVELVKHNRRSRLLSDFSQANGAAIVDSAITSPPAVPRQNAPIAEQPRQQTTERMLKNYGNIFQMDTKNLTEKQRSLLERIVERVARLGGSLEPDNNSQSNNDNLNESRSRQGNRNVRKKQTIDESDETVPITTTAGSTTTTKTIKKTTAGIIAHPTKPVSSSTAKVGKSKITQVSSQMRPNATEVVFGNITTSSIVDSLSKDNAREDLYARRPVAPAGPIIAEKANIKVSVFFLRSLNFCV